jgi:malonyl-CoA O-methyltransferase
VRQSPTLVDDELAAPEAPEAYRIDARAARRSFARRLTVDADVLASEVSRRMAERLLLIRLDPRRAIDAGCGLGEAHRLLHQRFPRVHVIALDLVPERVVRARSLDRWRKRVSTLTGRRRVSYLCADLRALPFADASASLVWSTLALSWAPDILAALREWQRVLEFGGLVMFATYGPDTLKELRAAFEQAGERLRVHSFADMHDIGDMLVAAGFADPVMDTDWLTLTYDKLEGLVLDLRMTGQTNALAARPRGLLSPRKWEAVRAAYPVSRGDGRLAATFEIVYGHAWKARPTRLADGRSIVRFAR